MLRKFFFLCLLFVFAQAASAQDKIYRKNGQVVLAKIIEIGSTDVKYKLPEQPESPTYVLEKDIIVKIVYADGRVEKFTPDLQDPEAYIGQRNKAIKIDFIGPLLGYTHITFEKSVGVGKSFEVGLGIIGAGKNSRLEYWQSNLQTERRNQFGLAGSFGYKFNKLPNFLFGKTRMSHLMQGSYAKPILYVGNYSENLLSYKANNSYVVERQDVTFGALQLELGKQWVFGEQLLLDTYGGFGYGFDNKKGDGSDWDEGTNSGAAFNYLNSRAGNSPGLSFTYGIKIGFLFK